MAHSITLCFWISQLQLQEDAMIRRMCQVDSGCLGDQTACLGTKLRKCGGSRQRPSSFHGNHHRLIAVKFYSINLPCLLSHS